MMLMWMRRKTRALEKVENLYRTATVQKNFPARLYKSNHARSILATFAQHSRKILASRTACLPCVAP
jgi:hypothetical protein